MRYLVLSDIHANLEALNAVLAAAQALPSDRVLVLGDLVGYGPHPSDVCAVIEERAQPAQAHAAARVPEHSAADVRVGGVDADVQR